MILVDEQELQYGTLALIGSNLGILKEKDEDICEYVDKVVNILKVNN